MARVLVDLLFMTGSRGGMETYVREIYSRMAPDVEWVALASHESAAAVSEWFPGEVINSGVRSSSRVAWAAAERRLVRLTARRVSADVTHSPANIGPGDISGRLILTIHDILPFRHPEWVPGPYSPVLRALIRSSVRAASHIITISEASRSDIHQVLGVPLEQLSVIPLAPTEPSTPQAALRETATFLAVGNRMPHKNLALVLHAVAGIPEGTRPRVVVIGGGADPDFDRTVASLGLEPWVSVRGWVGQTELERSYATSTALVLPSRFEGFGLPVLEAMQRGLPVICSDLPVLREVAADAALFVPADDPVKLGDAMCSIAADETLRTRLRDAGLARAATYNWQRTADATRATILASVDTP